MSKLLASNNKVLELNKNIALVSGMIIDSWKERKQAYLFQYKEEAWIVRYKDEAIAVKNRKGIKYIAHLICLDGKEISSLNLLNLVEHGIISDNETKYYRFTKNERNRLKEIANKKYEEYIMARRTGDFVKIEEKEEEWCKIKDTLITQYKYEIKEKQDKLFIKHRDIPYEEIEKARKSISNTIDYFLKKIRNKAPMLYDHFKKTIIKGRNFCYKPGSELKKEWKIEF